MNTVRSLWFKYGGTYLCFPPKCGGTAAYCAAFGVDPGLGNHVFSAVRDKLVPFEEVEWPAYLAVRDPVERFMSLWRNKCRDGDENMPGLKGMTVDELLGHVRADLYGNAHWTPQVAWITAYAQAVDYRILPEFMGLPSGRVNETEPRADDPAPPAEALYKLYVADLALWQDRWT